MTLGELLTGIGNFLWNFDLMNLLVLVGWAVLGVLALILAGELMGLATTVAKPIAKATGVVQGKLDKLVRGDPLRSWILLLILIVVPFLVASLFGADTEKQSSLPKIQHQKQ